MKSWKTTTCGILSVIAAGITLVAIPILDEDAATSANVAAFITAAIAGLGFLFSRDNDKTSEDVGAKKK